MDWKFNLLAKPAWLFAPAAFFVVALIFGAGQVEERVGVIPSAVPIVGAADSEVREIFATPTPTPIPVITEGPPTRVPETRAPEPTIVATPVPTTLSTTAAQVEGPTITSSIIVEAVDLAPILAAIATIDTEVDIDALIEAIDRAFGDLTIEITIEGTTETFTCDTRGQGCEEPPFGRSDQ